jgi:hydroxyacylglutathione hydrolase
MKSKRNVNWILTGIVTVASALMVGCPPPVTYEEIDVETAHQMWAQGVFMLDVRTVAEYGAGHVPDAYNLDVNELDVRIAEIMAYKDAEIVVYCKAGSRSATASTELVNVHGFTNVHNMLGGFDAWDAAGYEVAP